MTAVFIIFVALIVIAPVLTIIDSTFVYGLILINAATATALIALTFHAGDFRRLSRLAEPVALLLLIPGIWMLVQVMPIPGRSLPHSAWASASAALGRPLVGAISLDIGTTLLSLAQYLSMLSIAIIAAAIALDRRRTEIVLLMLTASAVIIATGSLCIDLGYFHTASADLSSLRSQALNVAVIGALLSATAVIHFSERNQSRSQAPRDAASLPANYAKIFAVVGFAICLLAIVTDADTMMVFAVAGGLSVLMSVVIIRRWRLGLWGQCGLAAAAVMGLIGFFSAISLTRDVDPTLWFSSQTSPVLSTADRILSDARLIGTGAGTFEALLPIYRDIDSAQTVSAPTTAALVAVEMGRPFLYGLIILAALGAYVLFRRSLQRGRDYYYAACGAGCLVAVTIASLANTGLFGLAASLLTASLLGMAFAQSQRSGNADATDAPPPPSLTLSIEQTRYAEDPPSQVRFRVGLSILSAILLALSVWILAAEYFRPSRVQLLVDRQTSLSRADAGDQQNAKRAASIGRIRGDLWAESAFTHSDLLWRDPPTAQDVSAGAGTDTRTDLENALKYAPHRGDAWLMLAAMADRYRWQDLQPAALLKMSYYTAPNDVALLPLRLQASLQPNNLKDPEIQDLIKRDIRFVVTKMPSLKPALIAAYKTAPPASKAMVERLVTEIDPTYLAAMRAGLQ